MVSPCKERKVGVSTFYFLAMICLLLSISMTSSAQQIFIFEQWVNDYEGTYATWFPTSDPFALNGWNEELEWDGDDAEGVNYAFMRFDDIVGNSSGLIPPNSEIISAHITLYITDAGDPADLHELLVPFDSEDGDLTMFNGGVDPRAGIDFATEIVSRTPNPSAVNATIDIDVTSSIQKIANGEEFLGWIFIPAGGGGVEFYGPWASSNLPKLVVLVEGDPTTQGRRTLSHSAVNIGDTVDVGIALSLESGSESVTVVETTPNGWAISDISDGGVLENGVITWVINNFSGTRTLTYKAQAQAGTGSNPEFSGVVNEFFTIAGDSELQVFVPLYATGNVLAVGVWNDSNSSSDIVATAELVDNNGNVYVRDSGHADGWPQGTIFRYQVVWDGMAGQEEAGWQERGFNDSAWIEQTDVGFTIGMGSNWEIGETPLDAMDETIYTRSVFDIADVDSIFQMTLRLEGDDSAVAWLNGVYIGVAGGTIGDNGEQPWEYGYNTTTASSGDVSGEESTDFVPGETFTIQIKAQPTVLTRMIPLPAFIPGEPVSGVLVTASVPAGQTPNLSITETPPAGWVVSNISTSAGSASVQNGSIVWTINKASGDQTLTYDVTPADTATADWDGSASDGTFTIPIEGDMSMDSYVGPVKLYREGNVLAIGVWNSDNGSSDLVLTAELVDSNGNVYVRDSGSPDGWPQGTLFRWKTVLFEDGSGAEEPGWQQRNFNDSAWTEQSDVGFTIGQGSGSENGETPVDGTHETIYTRSLFDVVDYDSVKSMVLKIEADDSGLAWLNGDFIGRDGSGTGDNGEVPPDFNFDTTTGGRSGGDVSGSPDTDYDPGSVIYILVDLVDSTPVLDWSLF